MHIRPVAATARGTASRPCLEESGIRNLTVDRSGASRALTPGSADAPSDAMRSPQ